MTAPLIGLCGFARAGKDTVGHILVERHGFTRVAFADPLKQLAAAVDPVLDVEDGNRIRRYTDTLTAEGEAYVKDAYPEYRRFLQALGLGVRQVLGADTWVDAAMAQISRIGGPVVVTDVRFPNEVDAIRQCGGQVWLVDRPGLQPDLSHVSEQLPQTVVPDMTVVNDGDLPDLQTVVCDALLTAFNPFEVPAG